MSRPIGIILAGGQSSRMGGGDKSLGMLGGKALIAHVIERLGPQVEQLVISANGDPKRFAEFGLPVVGDSIEGFAGPLAGVLAGMDFAAEAQADRIVTAAADTPFFPGDLVGKLRMASLTESQPIAMAATPDPKRGLSRHPTFALWPVALREDLRKALQAGQRKVILWSDHHGCASAEFDTHPFDPFFNVNTPDDMDVAQSLLPGVGR